MSGRRSDEWRKSGQQVRVRETSRYRLAWHWTAQSSQVSRRALRFPPLLQTRWCRRPLNASGYYRWSRCWWSSRARRGERSSWWCHMRRKRRTTGCYQSRPTTRLPIWLLVRNLEIAYCLDAWMSVPRWSASLAISCGKRPLGCETNTRRPVGEATWNAAEWTRSWCCSWPVLAWQHALSDTARCPIEEEGWWSWSLRHVAWGIAESTPEVPPVWGEITKRIRSRADQI